jgi:ribosome-binding protein aMBF1 (putative translation factor)
MHKTKRKKLRAAGWSVGTTKDFLKLSPEEALLIEIKLDLAAAVRRERTRRHWTQAHLAQVLDSSQSRLAKMKTGDRTVSIDLLVGALVRMGVTRSGFARVMRTSAA